jgi:lipopolysaccharide export LptBFGC system permease protein LptF
MTIDHPIRRFLARLCSADTMARVVDPTLADMRWESGKANWKGYLALAKALVVHSIVSTPAILSRTWSDDERAIPRAVAFLIGCTFVASLPLVAAPLLPLLEGFLYWGRSGPIPVVPLAVLLIPQALPLTLPAALLLAIPLALRRQNPSARLARRIVALSIACMAAMFVVLAWVRPATNQAFRVMVISHLSGRPVELERGVNEKGFAAMRERIEDVKLTYRGQVAARSLEFDYHVRVGLIFIPLPFGVLGLAISRSRRGRRRPWGMGLAAVAGYALTFVPLLIGARMLMRWSSLSPVLFAWTPIVLLAILAFRIYSSTPALPDSSAAS